MVSNQRNPENIFIYFIQDVIRPFEVVGQMVSNQRNPENIFIYFISGRYTSV